jgi:hypothetical protein
MQRAVWAVEHPATSRKGGIGSFGPILCSALASSGFECFGVLTQEQRVAFETDRSTVLP